MSEGTNFLAAIVATGSVSSLRQADIDHFVDDEEREIYRYLTQHLEAYAEVASWDAVAEQTGYELPEITDSVDYHWENLVQRRLYNDIRPEYDGLRGALRDRSFDDIRDIVGRMSTINMANETTVDLLPASEVGRITMERYLLAHSQPGIVGVPTGWPTIDTDTGGYQGGDLVIWAARPSTGKTWLLLRQARFAAQAGFNVMFVTMEMGLAQIGTRFFGMVSGVNPRLVRDGALSNRAQRMLQRTVDDWHVNHRLHFYSGNMGQTTTALNAAIVEINPDVVFVDGVYFMKSPTADRNANRNTNVAYAIDDLKRIALTRDIPVVGTTQFSREAGTGGRKGSMETIAYTDAMSTHASLIYSVQRAHARAQNQNALLINTQKGREGEAANLAVSFQFSPVNFDEVDLSQATDPRDAEEVNLNWMRSENENST